MRTCELGTDRIVVRVEEFRESRIGRAVLGGVRLEEERLEEPARVGEVPLSRTDIGTRLNHVIFGGEWSAKLQTLGTDMLQLVDNIHGGTLQTSGG